MSIVNDTATAEIYTLSLHDALPIFEDLGDRPDAEAVERPDHAIQEAPRADAVRRVHLEVRVDPRSDQPPLGRSEEHTSELQPRHYPVCRLLLGKKTHRTHHLCFS